MKLRSANALPRMLPRMSDAPSTQRLGDFTRAYSASGAEVYLHPTRRFKSKELWIELAASSQDRRPVRALLPALLRRGTRNAPSLRALACAMEDLSSCQFGDELDRSGGVDLLLLRANWLDGRFLPPGEDPEEGVLRLAQEILQEPRLDDGGHFPAAVFEQERRQLARAIEAESDDKSDHAWRRFREEFLRPLPEAERATGTAAEVRGVENAELVETWRRAAFGAGGRLCAVGDVDLSRLIEFADALQLAPWPPRQPWQRVPDLGRGQWIEEEEEVEQARLCLGVPVSCEELDERGFTALALLGSLLGGGMHSRLFRVVREREGMAYSVHGLLDRTVGAWMVTAGVDGSMRHAVTERVVEMLDELRRHGPTEEEWRSVQALAVAGLRSAGDSPNGLLGTLASGLHFGTIRSQAERIEAVQAATLQEGKEAAERFGNLDIAYALVGTADSGRNRSQVGAQQEARP